MAPWDPPLDPPLLSDGNSGEAVLFLELTKIKQRAFRTQADWINDEFLLVFLVKRERGGWVGGREGGKGKEEQGRERGRGRERERE